MSGFQTFLTKEFSFERAVTRELVLLCRSREGVWSLVGQSEVPGPYESTVGFSNNRHGNIFKENMSGSTDKQSILKMILSEN